MRQFQPFRWRGRNGVALEGGAGADRSVRYIAVVVNQSRQVETYVERI